MLLTAFWQIPPMNGRNLTKLILVMKLTIILMISSCLAVNATGHAQRITLSEHNALLTTVFKKIEKQTSYNFVYRDEWIVKAKRVDIRATNATLEQVLSLCFDGQPLTYTIIENTIVIKQKQPSIVVEDPQPVTAFADITGRVTDARSGEAIIGASVQVKGSRQGTTTNLQGRYNITVEPGKVLVISSVGYASQEVAVGPETNIDIRLEVTTASLKDVVVTGLFTRKASTSTGSVSTFSQAELMRAGTTNVIQSLKNLEPAFFIPENNLAGSNPNVLPDIQVRGQTGLPDVKGEYSTNPNNPLFILDGVPVTLQTIVDLDMNRIRSATLLLDASSKAIYGSRAANGVMVIETTVPRSGKILVSYNTNITLSAPDLSSYNLTNAREKLDVEVAAGLYNGVGGPNQYALKQKYNEFLQNIEAGVNTDWISKPVRNGVGQQHSLTFEGGEPAGMRYQATLRYYNQVGVMKGSDRNTLTGAIKLAYRVKTFNFTNTFTINDNKANNSPWGSFSQFVAMNPYLPYQDANGRILKIITNYSRQVGVAGTTAGAPTGFFINDVLYNPAYNSTLNIIDATKYTQYLNTFNFDWAIKPEFRINGTLGITKQIDQGDVFLPAEHLTFTTAEFSGDNIYRRGRYTKSNGNYFSYTGNLVFTYAKAFGKHVITANLPLGLSEIRSRNLSFAVEGFPNDRLSDPALALQYFTAVNTRPTGTESQIRRAEGALAANYAYNDKYFFEFTAGKSKGTDAGFDAPWSDNWSVGVGWNLHHEKFIEKLKIINLLKVSANTGFIGAEGFSSFSSLATYNYYLNNSYSTFGNGAILTGLGNPDLQPQRSHEHSLEGRLGLFRRLSLTFRYYIRNTEGLVSDITTPPSTGFITYKANLGKTQNKGYNANINLLVFSNARGANSLNIFAAVAHNTNKLVAVANAFKVFNSTQDATTSKAPRIRFIEGQSLNTIWAVKSLGIDPATGREVYQKLDGTQTYVWDAKDQIAAGDALPKYNGNAGFRLAIQGFDLNTIFTYVLGGQQYNQTLVNRVENADLYRNVDRRVFTDRWRNPGDVSFYKNIADFSITQASTRFVEDRNTLTLGSIDLGYDFFRSFRKLRNMGFSRLRAGFNTSEVFIVSTIRTERGTDYPFARNFAFTLNASF